MKSSRRYQSRRYHLKSSYNLTLEDIEAIKIHQKGQCPLCFAPIEKYVVDHDHQTQAVRGLLCRRCNGRLAHYEQMAKEPEWCDRAARYLSRPLIYVGPLPAINKMVVTNRDILHHQEPLARTTRAPSEPPVRKDFRKIRDLWVPRPGEPVLAAAGRRLRRLSSFSESKRNAQKKISATDDEEQIITA